MRIVLLSALLLFVSVADAQIVNRETVKDEQPNKVVEPIVLNEVQIIHPKIRQNGDTIEYLVSSFMDKNDRTIGDVLKKLPGIDVKEDGQIVYQSLAIEKFYIEGSDLLQGRYGIAIKNIGANDVQTVQILENHQEIKLLRDKETSEQTAINLKLKESAKGVLTSGALLGAGFSPFLRTGEIIAMYFTKNMQNITAYKGNNTGNDVSAEQNMLYSIGSFYEQDARLLGLQEPSPPSIHRKRYLFNRADAVTFNNLWTSSDDYQINANINYLNDRIDKSSFARTEYYLMRSNFFNVEEQLHSRSYVNYAHADIQLNADKEKFYLNNTLSFSGGWNNADGTAITGDTIRQHLEKPEYCVNNTFELIKDYAKTSLKITSYNSYSLLPHSMTVEPILHRNLFDYAGKDFISMQQRAATHRFSSISSVSGKISQGNFHQDYSLSFRADLRHLDSKLTVEPQEPGNPSRTVITPDSLRNNLQWNKSEWIFTPQYTYRYRGWRFILKLPVNFTDLTITERINQSEDENYRLFFNPSLRIRYKISDNWDLYSSAGYSHEFGGINDEYTGFIMRTYRSLTRNEGDLLETAKQSYSTGLYYKNPNHSFFGNISIDYTNTKANLLYGYDFKGILQVQKTLLYPNSIGKTVTQISLNQAIDAIASTVRLCGNYTLATSSQIAQGRIITSALKGYSAAPEILTRLGSHAGFSYRFDYSERRNTINNDNKVLKPIRSIIQDIQLNLFPMKNLTVNLSYEYFHNSAIVSGSRTMSFGDMGVKYKLNAVEFLLDYTNIFNSKQYITASYNNIYSYYYVYDLRPAEIVLSVRIKLK